MASSLDDARSAKPELAAILAGDDRINGIGIGYDDDGYVLTVNLSVPEAADAVPQSVRDVLVRTQVVGTIEAQ